MESNWVYFIKLVFILYFQNACYGSTSVPTRDFTLRLPQAKPTQPETYVSSDKLRFQFPNENKS